VWCVWGFAAAVALVCRAVDNGDFGDGLRRWKAAWHVTETGGEAVLSDAEANHAFLFQASSPSSSVVAIEFDFLNALSSTVSNGLFRDSFYASLYAVNDLSDFITEHDRFDDSHGLMDLDAEGTYNVQGSITNSPKGGQWSRFSGVYTNSRAFLIVMFELYDLNFIADDSSVRIDNVGVEGTP